MLKFQKYCKNLEKNVLEIDEKSRNFHQKVIRHKIDEILGILKKYLNFSN